MLYIPIIFLALGLIVMTGWTLPTLRDLWDEALKASEVIPRIKSYAYFLATTALVSVLFILGLIWLYEIVKLVP